jgi:hypothetical protein
MWIEKIRRGVLQVSTDHGPRYVNPSLMERVQLVWMFRNFHILNPEIMSRHQRSLVDTLCDQGRNGVKKGVKPEQLCIIGTVETIPPLPPRKAPASSMRSSVQSSA